MQAALLKHFTEHMAPPAKAASAAGLGRTDSNTYDDYREVRAHSPQRSPPLPPRPPVCRALCAVRCCALRLSACGSPEILRPRNASRQPSVPQFISAHSARRKTK